ncbi:ABC transporter substrate-binding protein [Paenibacillus spongiae]|uniref:Iron-siderophore ABC transporter substrate-binding protein n=1 Tax=Paenibacillus spongiae TaxID=2909671 RepID=A0ABY5SBX1_9BACL|nr:iron-siderophore ABC transporter substrate-binding protein [Paenibacillus spongiae]UVI31025.1 iron-siderophore ABC transporter substrate-binding protein [Paenibacillus spongiae]
MFKSPKVMVALAMLLMVMLVIAGCGTDKNAGTEGQNKPEEKVNGTNNKEAAAGNNEQSADVRVIEHAMGKTEIKGTPLRVVTLYQGATDVAVALGVTPVGVVDSWVEEPMYLYLRDQLKDVPHVGLETQPNLEEISKLKPDLIIASKLRHEKIYDQLSQIAPTVTHETVFKFKETLDLMGKAMNKEEEAAKLLADWTDRVADFKQKIETKQGADWPIEVSVLNFRADHARIYVTGYAGDILNELGFTRSASQQEEEKKGTVVLKLTSMESIPSMDADTFFIFTFDAGEEDGAVQKTYDDWTGHPLWKELKAVKNDKVYMVNEVTWNNGGGIIAANKMLDELYDHFGLAK